MRYVLLLFYGFMFFVHALFLLCFWFGGEIQPGTNDAGEEEATDILYISLSIDLDVFFFFSSFLCKNDVRRGF